MKHDFIQANHIGEEGSEPICQLLKNNTTLTSIDIRGILLPKLHKFNECVKVTILGLKDHKKLLKHLHKINQFWVLA